MHSANHVQITNLISLVQKKQRMRRKFNAKVPQFMLYLALKYAWPTIEVSACIQCNFDVYVKISFEINH